MCATTARRRRRPPRCCAVPARSRCGRRRARARDRPPRCATRGRPSRARAACRRALATSAAGEESANGAAAAAARNARRSIPPIRGGRFARSRVTLSYVRRAALVLALVGAALAGAAPARGERLASAPGRRDVDVPLERHRVRADGDEREGVGRLDRRQELHARLVERGREPRQPGRRDRGLGDDALPGHAERRHQHGLVEHGRRRRRFRPVPGRSGRASCGNSLASAYYNFIWGSSAPTIAEPLVFGLTWPSHGGAGNTVRSTNRVVGIQDVTVPAFAKPLSALRIESRSRSPATRTAAARARSGGSGASGRSTPSSTTPTARSR